MSARSVGVAATVLGAVVVIAMFAIQGSEELFKGDPQSYRLVAEDPFGIGDRIAADPDVFDQGVEYRYARILFPFLAWLLALGQSGAVAWTIPIVVVGSFGACAYFAAKLCLAAGMPGERALFVAGVPTLISSLALLYAEPLAAALILGTFATYLDGNKRASLLLAACLLLTREAFGIGVLPLLFAEWESGTARRTVGLAMTAAAPYIAWLVWIRWRFDNWSFLDPSTSRTDAVGLPIVSPLVALRDADGNVALIVGTLLVASISAATAIGAIVVMRRMKRDRLIVHGIAAFAFLGLFVGPQGYRFSGDGLRVLLPAHLMLALLAARTLVDSPDLDEPN